MLDRKLAQVGDICVYKNRGWLGFFCDGYGHIAVVSETIPKIKIIEAHLSAYDDTGKKVSGILEKTLNQKWDTEIELYRIKQGLSARDKRVFISRVRTELVGKVKYDIESFPSLWIWSNILRPIGLGNLTPITNSRHKVVCSSWPHEYFKAYLGIDLFPALYDEAGDPGDYPYSPELFRVC